MALAASRAEAAARAEAEARAAAEWEAKQVGKQCLVILVCVRLGCVFVVSLRISIAESLMPSASKCSTRV